MSIPRRTHNAPRIHSKRYPVDIGDKRLTLFDAEEQGLVEVIYDIAFGWYSYIVKSSGEVVSFYNALRVAEWPEWLREHRRKQRDATGEAAATP